MDKTKNNPAQIIWNMDSVEMSMLNRISSLGLGNKQHKDQWLKSLKRVISGMNELPNSLYNDIYVNLESESWQMLKISVLNLLGKMGYDQFKNSAYYTIQDMDLSKMFK